ncbi:MAG TPA: hypothetical protein VHH36_04515 [Candidatus Thermoplasmatota archaeon]|nr:hypothetical protein [Candidatus Thermoplasmatota archaeon]
MTTLDQLLARVVERKGFTVAGSDAGALLARKGTESLLVAWSLDGPVTQADAQMFLGAMAQIPATSGILVAPRGVDAGVKEAVAAKGVDVWAESRLVVEVGEALVRDALDPPHPAAALPPTPTAAPAQPAAPAKPAQRAFPSLVAQAASASQSSGSGAAYFMPNKPKPQPADMQAQIPQRGQALGYAWGGPASTSSPGIAQVRSGKPRIQTDQWGNVVQAAPAATPTTIVPDADVEITTTPRKRGAPAAQAASAAPAPVAAAPQEEAYEILSSKKPAAPAASPVAPAGPIQGCTTLKVKVGRDEAAAKASARTPPKLALVPHVAFAYDLHMERPGMPAPVEAQGALLLSSLSGEIRSVDRLEFEAADPAEARKDQVKLTAVDLYDKVKGHMAKTYGRTQNVEREVAGNTVMETLKLTPDPEEMGLDHKGIVYVPVWEMTGPTGPVKVDAYTGAVS